MPFADNFNSFRLYAYFTVNELNLSQRSMTRVLFELEFLKASLIFIQIERWPSKYYDHLLLIVSGEL